jgi:tetratricopeptide (TPR) repeat protein
MPVMGRNVVPALLIAGLSATAGAQQKACEIDESNPAQITRAVLNLQIAQQATKPGDAAAKLRDAVKLIGEGDLKRNPVGRAFEMGRTLVIWSTQPGLESGVASRGTLGFVTDTAAKFDLVAGIDSAFAVVEASNPDCISQTLPYRQQKLWVDMVNKAMQLNEADKNDSATVYARRSLTLSKHAPYGYLVLAQVAQKESKVQDAIANYKLAIGASKDTTLNDTRRQLQAMLGNFASDAAEQATGAEKTALVNEAKAAFDALAKDPGSKYADAARSGQARIASISGDTAAIKATYADQLANPGAFNYNALMAAAVTAAKTNQNKDAIKLFEAAAKVNPYHRDVLYNLARLQLLDSAYAVAIPNVRRLVEVDPSNPDNYQLMAIAYNGIQKNYSIKQKELEAKAKALGQRANTSKRPAEVKAAIDSAGKLNAPIKAYTDSTKTYVDSTLKYNSLMTSIPARVSFNEFTPGDNKVSIGGTIANQTEAARPFTIKIDFLDKSGAVVSSQTVQVESVAPKASKSFKAEGTGAGIVAFRYAPIS